MSWWVMPGLTLGAALYTKYKRRKGKFRWVKMTTRKAKSLPPGLVLARDMESGDALPEPPQGYEWEPMTLLLSTTPLTPPEEVVLHALRPKIPVEAPVTMDGMASSYLTTQEAKGSPDLGWWGNLLTVEDCAEYEMTKPRSVSRHDPLDLATAQGPAEMGGMGSTYLTSQEVDGSPRLGEIVERDGRGKRFVVRQMRPSEARRGDFVVLQDCSVHQVVRRGTGGLSRIREIRPQKGVERDVDVTSGRVQCAFGARRA